MTKPLIVFTDDTIHPAAAEKLKDAYELRILPGSYPQEAVLAEACADAHIIMARMGAVTKRVIEAAPHLRMIVRHGIGVDDVALDEATKRGIPVVTTGSTNAGAVAEYAFALLLGLARKIPQADGSMRTGAWSRGPLIGYELAGKTLGILGLGAIGTLMAQQALGFRMNVIAHDPFAKPSNTLQVEMTSREELLARSDIVSLHMRLSPETAHTLDAAAIGALKPGALIVNTARGGLIDEQALIASLNAGHLGGAALDVYEVEPLPAESVLRTMSNVILSPHVSGQTAESMRLVALAMASAVFDEFAGRIPPFVYNPASYEIRSGHQRV